MKIVMIDASGYFYKAFFVSPENPANAVRNMIASALDYHKPNRAVLALDAGRETFRNQIYPLYKANRAPAPKGYSHACPSMTAAVIAMGIKPYSVPGFEADDIIGTLCAQHDDDKRIILSRDKDLMQLVDDGPQLHRNVSMWHDGRETTEAEVIEKFGVHPSRIVEIMGLAGDGADGIPGVPGIGIKTAIALIQYFQDLDNLFENLGDVPNMMSRGGERIRKKLEQSREIGFLSRRLATIRTDVNLGEGI